jgi:hypothetical protein
MVNRAGFPVTIRRLCQRILVYHQVANSDTSGEVLEVELSAYHWFLCGVSAGALPRDRLSWDNIPVSNVAGFLLAGHLLPSHADQV